MKGDTNLMEELDKAFEKVIKFINESDKPDSDEFLRAVRNLKELLDLREKLNPKPPVIEMPEVKKKLTQEVLAVLGIVVPALTSIISIVLIIKHEELNVITSKAMGFVMRSRI